MSANVPSRRARQRPERIGPQAGPQWEFARCEADIAIKGGAAGGGKSYALLFEPFRYQTWSRYRGVIFRRTTVQLKQPGGLWDQARDLYAGQARSRETFLDFTFPSGARLKLAHLEHEKNVEDWQGSAADYFAFDELTQFSERQFWYIALSRARSISGIRPYVRASCNPNPDSFVRPLIDWWIGDDGFPIEERSGVIRWFYRIEGEMLWYGSEEEAREDHPELDHRPKSFTFIPSKLEDNPALDLVDPDYRAGLEALHRVDRERLLKGNWNIRLEAGLVFNSADFCPIQRVQLEVAEKAGGVEYFRGWDKAGTEGGTGARTAGVKIGRYRGTGRFVVAHAVARRLAKIQREKLIVQIAHYDGLRCQIWIEREGGSDGKWSAQATIAGLAGYIANYESATGAKIDRAMPFAVQVGAGNVDIVVGEIDPVTGEDWSRGFLEEAMNFDGKTGLMDQIDAAGIAFKHLATGGEPGAVIG